MVTHCNTCKWFNGGCEFGRLEKYRAQNEADENKVFTFCNYARPLASEASKEDVIKDNKIRFDLVVRINSVDEISNINLDFKLAPKKIVLSYTGLSREAVMAKAAALNMKNLEVVEIFNDERREELELEYCKSQFIAYINSGLDDIITDLDNSINNDLKKIVFLEGDWGYIYMRYLGKWCIENNLVPCQENFRNLIKVGL